mmetsp:Transcript_8545/g.12411  ORF Transcript_8545/g.12411 Transcript_8545/m.12411 type:complete len:139 (+) Transcript_8545:58-474(+)|eukprot:CAMPEP_0195520726 /NCGR_PEP_ID=MMETSP0794_2-20130614/17497_1 /TAXON_ID=515487 /ORGANISM="Stephanopyxis turris, Strain CCMP 815" /LENGTH=138 /DNA_ID=CAMNT_0040650145 /DNA_START=55 /DNA_END=471 /DNA_ORIENTATION=+
MVMQAALRGSAAARRVSAAAVSKSKSKRSFGAHAAPEWTGIDKIVRSYFPEDHQLAGAVLAGYGFLITGAVLRGKMKGKPEEEPVAASTAAAATSSGDIPPSVESADFEAFLNNDAAFGKFLESEESMMKWVDTLSQD